MEKLVCAYLGTFGQDALISVSIMAGLIGAKRLQKARSCKQPAVQTLPLLEYRFVKLKELLITGS
jgi:hypothetical protein